MKEQTVQRASEVKRVGVFNGMSELVTNLDLALIPAGSFMMGDQQFGPVHQVTISKDYYLGKEPVTQSLWASLMGDNPSNLRGADKPVEQVSWDDCQKFISRLNSLEKEYEFRLPTEAEWEYACRAGSVDKFCFGDSVSQLGDYAWYNANSESQTQPVGKKKPNAWGLHDMHGNVWEWCQDWYGDYSAEAVTDPQGISAGSLRVNRGGSWRYDPDFMRSALRNSNPPGFRCRCIGFRILALPVSASSPTSL